jgi:hypothetical protein
MVVPAFTLLIDVVYKMFVFELICKSMHQFVQNLPNFIQNGCRRSARI